MTDTLRVVRAGNTRVQDLGRIGAERIGLSVNGALDEVSASCANVLVGNDRGAALLELTRFDAEFAVEHDTLVAVTGARAEVLVDDVVHPAEQPIPLRRGQRLRVGGIHDGMRTYLALVGGVDAPRLAGSAAADPIVGFPQRLEDGATVRSTSSYRPFVHPVFGLPLFRFPVPDPRRDSRRLPDGTRAWTVDVTAGTETPELADPTQVLEPFRIGTLSDHVGLRLEGGAVERSSDRELVSRGVPVGGVELLPDGGLVVLLNGRYVTAGYPVVAVVGRSSLAALGQAAPGDVLHLRWRAPSETVARYRALRAAVDLLEQRVTAAFLAVGVHAGRSD